MERKPNALSKREGERRHLRVSFDCRSINRQCRLAAEQILPSLRRASRCAEACTANFAVNLAGQTLQLLSRLARKELPPFNVTEWRLPLDPFLAFLFDQYSGPAFLALSGRAVASNSERLVECINRSNESDLNDSKW